MAVDPPVPDLDVAATSLIVAALDDEIAAQGAVLPAMNEISTRLGLHLTRWIGSDGWQALLGRALEAATAIAPNALVLAANGALTWSDGPRLDQARDACAAVLSAVVRMLARFIGADMTLRIIERSLAEPDDASTGGSSHG